MATSDSYHYVLILQVEKVNKKLKSTPTGNRWESEKIEELSRETTEVAKVIIKDKLLGELIDRGKKHLDLVEEDNL